MSADSQYKFPKVRLNDATRPNGWVDILANNGVLEIVNSGGSGSPDPGNQWLYYPLNAGTFVSELDADGVGGVWSLQINQGIEEFGSVALGIDGGPGFSAQARDPLGPARSESTRLFSPSLFGAPEDGEDYWEAYGSSNSLGTQGLRGIRGFVNGEEVLKIERDSLAGTPQTVMTLANIDSFIGFPPAVVDWDTQQGDGTENASLDFNTLLIQTPGSASGLLNENGFYYSSGAPIATDWTVSTPNYSDADGGAFIYAGGSDGVSLLGPISTPSPAVFGLLSRFKQPSTASNLVLTGSASSGVLEIRGEKYNNADTLTSFVQFIVDSGGSIYEDSEGRGFFGKAPVARPNLTTARANIAAEVATLNGVATGLGNALLALFDAFGNGTSGLGLTQTV